MVKFLLLLLVAVMLQTYLSRNNNKVLGLLLPFLNIVYAIVHAIGLETSGYMEIISDLVLNNVSTVMLLVIYFTIKKTLGVEKNIEGK